MQLPASLTTDRLSLGSLTLDDHGFIRELVNTEGWLRFIGDRKVQSAAEAKAYIARIQAALNITYWVVRLRAAATPIGVISFMKRDYLDHFDIGFAFLPEYMGQGYAHEAASHVLAMLRQQPAHAVVLATTLGDNASSISLLGKLGLRFERELDHDNLRLQVYTTASEPC